MEGTKAQSSRRIHTVFAKGTAAGQNLLELKRPFELQAMNGAVEFPKRLQKILGA
jgi:hypothetical protein